MSEAAISDTVITSAETTTGQGTDIADTAETENIGDFSDLHDIMMPDFISWWPLQPVCWVALFLLCVSLLMFVLYWKKLSAQNTYRKLALQELQHICERKSWHEMPVLLKRCALAAWPREEIAALSGNQWILWLNAHGGNFDQTAAQYLHQLSYARKSINDINDNNDNNEKYVSLMKNIEAWIRQHPQHPQCSHPQCPHPQDDH